MRIPFTLDDREFSLAKFIRHALRRMLITRGREPWMRYAGFVKSGEPRSSQSVDELVYGAKD